MFASIYVILSDGRIYLALYAWLSLAMLIEAFYNNGIVSRWLARIGMALIILLIGLRWDTGTDWMSYMKVFYTNESSSDYDSAVFGIDQGYIAFNRIMHAFSTDYTVFLMADAILAMTAVYIFIEKSTKFPNMGVHIFYSSYAITHFMGSNRRMIAIGFVCLGFLFLSRQQRLREQSWRWAAPFFVAATMHRTSLGALPGLTVSRRAWPTWAVILGLIACLALGVSGLPFNALDALGDFLSGYTGITAVQKLIFYTSGDAQQDLNTNLAQQAILGVAKRAISLIIFVSYIHFGKPSEYTQRLYNVYIVGCAIYFTMISVPIFQIVSTYYSIVEIVLFPIIFYEIKSLKIPYFMYILLITVLLLFSSLSPYLQLYVPYRSIFGTY